MLTRAFAVFALLFFVLFSIQSLFFRNRARKISTSPKWDIAPVLGFLGVVLLALSFAEATRSDVVEAWRWGLALGLVVSASAGVALIYGWKSRAAQAEPFVRVLWRFMRICGVPLAVAILGIVVAIRYFGAALEVFVASTIAIIIIATAVSLFAVGWRRRAVGSKQ